ncbi:MAG: 50S ribosomal protein L37ae [Candidatus Micrarchaeia archaeon]
MVDFNVRSGAKLRELYYKTKKKKQTLYRCPLCGKKKVKRIAAGIWQCKNCKVKFAGDANSFELVAEV